LSADLVRFELGWQRRLLAALVRADPRPAWAIEATRCRIEALGKAVVLDEGGRGWTRVGEMGYKKGTRQPFD